MMDSDSTFSTTVRLTNISISVIIYKVNNGIFNLEGGEMAVVEVGIFAGAMDL